ncbi:AfsR/SARP family transcriptional regulator [Kutzneria sp. CA-103260]|uniref:AfsR/SARP family transcriptional regulator n=1 Tax=Kutzneria sp. CA-103260 TaxID=2802641 RepID=UPI001BA78B89|nr:BTAD domain-containing putative transcriptional regulator [Kutzneria sp. CA-103260]QUQ68995.1 SARP family transcriptional regulator [Kutzneria sp. CA-103260]
MHFLVLGPLEVRASGKQVRVDGSRQRRLLAILLLNANHTVTVERLAQELWADPPQSVRQQIHNAIASLRRTLGAAFTDLRITTTDAGYELGIPESWIDLHEFGRLTQLARRAEADGRLEEAVTHLTSALGLWRGAPLLGLDSPLISSTATALDEQRLAAVESRISLRLRIGQADSVIGELRELVDEHPYRESLRASLMTALYRTSRQADALDVYEQGRRLLADELGIDPGPQIRELHAKILSGTPEQPGPDAVEPSPMDAPPPAHRFLPNDTRDFSGRSAELDRLLADAQEAGPSALVISAINGMGGIGKTTLAVRLAHQLADEYPDGQFFLDLHGFTLGMEPVSPARALETLLQAAGTASELVPLGLDGRAARWRAHMAGKRALLILDNAVDAAQVRPLLPGTSGILVVVTSRRRLTSLEGAVSVSLDLMPAQDAITLFTRIAGANRTATEPAAVATAVELCGRLPLAIRIAAARLRDRQSWTVADLVSRLEDQKRRSRLLDVGDRNVMAVLKVSHRYLQPMPQRLFRLLHLHPGPDFDARAAAALGGLDVPDAEDALEMLLDDNLLRQETSGRYYFHDLVRDCSRELSEEFDSAEERKRARFQLVDHYLHASLAWCEHFQGGLRRVLTGLGPAPETVDVADAQRDPMGALAAEYENIAAISQLAAEHGWHRHAWQLACVLHPYLRSRNFDRHARRIFERGIQAAQADDNIRGEAACRYGLVQVCQARGEKAEARQQCEHAIRLSRQVGDEEGEAEQLSVLGALHYADNELGEAHDNFRLAEIISRRASAPASRQAIVNNLGVICRETGRLDEALVLFEEALSAARSSADRRDQVVYVQWNIATVHHMRGDHAMALKLFDQELDASVELKFERGEALARLGLSDVKRSIGDLDGAIADGRHALALSRKSGVRNTECEALLALGEAIFCQGDLDRAAEVFERAREHAEEYDMPRFQARALEGFAHIARAAGDVELAGRRWTEAISLYPAEFVEAQYARVHLDSLGDPTATCFRCATTAV